MDVSSVYIETQERIIDLLHGADTTVMVPACPEWTVGDVLAHVAGLAADVADNRVKGYASEAWTARQVAAGRGVTKDQIIARWRDRTADLGRVLDEPEDSLPGSSLSTSFGPVPLAAVPFMIVTDLASHEQDIRGALRMPGAGDSAAVHMAIRSHVGYLRAVQMALSLPVISLTATDVERDWPIGRDEPAGGVRAPIFELFRATGGRRTVAEIAELDWWGDTGRWVDHLVVPSYAAPENSVGY